MKIHTVKEGDTVFSIAREYSVPPMKIIENNELKNPDLLAVGTELIIITPTRTYSARGGDTLEKISERFSVPMCELYRQNPYLSGKGSLYPGQIISVRQDERGYGTASSMGYLFRGYREERLLTAIHYLSQLVICAYKIDADGKMRETFNPQYALSLCEKFGKLPLMRIYDSRDRHNASRECAEEIMHTALSTGFSGMILPPSTDKELVDHLNSLSEEYGIHIILEADLNDCESPIRHGRDGTVLMYEKCHAEKIDSKESERGIYERASDGCAARCYIDLPSFAYIGNKAITKEEALAYAKDSAKEILHDKERGICHFTQNEYNGGKKDVLRVAFESLENIKTKLTLIYELGLMGISFDIMRVPIEYLLAFNSMYSLPYSEVR